MINVQCPSCKRVYTTQDAAIGKRVQCKDCGTTFVAHQVLSASPQQAETQPAAVTLPQQDPAASSMDELARAAEEMRDPSRPEKPQPARLESHALSPKRPFGLTWVVFYWVLSGVIGTVVGYLMVFGSGVAAEAVRGSSELFDELGYAGRKSAAILALVEFAGLFLFHYGILLLVACYGLWTFRRWGIVLGRAMAIAGVALSVIVLIVSIVSRARIVAGVADLVISAVILVYLFASASFSARLREYFRAAWQYSGS